MSEPVQPRRTRTRFICTIGPPVKNREALLKLRENGMDIARVNGAHGSLDDVRSMVTFLRENLPKGVEILLDLPGNKVRTDGILKPIDLVVGEEFVIPPTGVTYRPLYTLVKPGFRISAADGAIQLDVVEVRGEDIVTKVVVGGPLLNRKGMNIRGIHDAMPFDFERDISLLNLAIELKVDYVGLSFVRTTEHVRRIKAQLVGTNVRAVAKVETAEAVDLLPNILAIADMIMLDRGDLEAEIGRENVPLAQKRIIKGAKEAGVPVIVASQFMTSMMDKPLPFMAEVSDIANAVMDGADVLMLSEETAIGKYPYDCIGTMRLVAETIEKRRRTEYGAVILAAGPSTGFGSLTSNKHKCMLDVGGVTIVSHQLENLRACGVRDENIVVVTGHNHAQVEAYLKGEGFGGRFVFNPWYATSNILVSTWLARPTGNFVLLYGDIIFERAILADLLATSDDAALAVDFDSEMSPEDEKVRVVDGHVVAAGKELDPAAAHGEFIGLARFTARAAKILIEEAEARVKQGHMMAFLTEALERLPERGVPLRAASLEGRPWGDNDGLVDLEHSREKIFPRILAARRAHADIPRS